jgi:hypothetical protein
MNQRWRIAAGRLVPAAVGLLAVLLAGCGSGRYASETCRQERQRSKQIARSSFCERTTAPQSDRALDVGWHSSDYDMGWPGCSCMGLTSE